MREMVLVVDDEPDVVDLVGYHLKGRGYDVATASNGLDALRKVSHIHPNIIVLDVMMDGMDGLSVCEILRAQPSTRMIPIILLTAATSEIARVNGFGAGAADFVSKPFSPHDLVRRVASLLESSHRNATSE
jgi:DNA-binding response OmpR family regulator